MHRIKVAFNAHFQVFPNFNLTRSGINLTYKLGLISIRVTFFKRTLMQIWKSHMKIICWRFEIKTSSILWDMRTWVILKLCLQTFRNNRICQKLAYFLRNLQTSWADDSRILRIKNAKFSGYCFDMNTTYREIFKSALVYL